MSIIQPAASQSSTSSRESLAQHGLSQQAGRSATNLDAERSARDIQLQSRTRSSQSLMNHDSILPTGKDPVLEESQSPLEGGTPSPDGAREEKDTKATNLLEPQRPPGTAVSATSTGTSQADFPRGLGDPFDTRNNSQFDVSLATPLPRYNSSSHLMAGVSSTDLAQRLSNPFKDDRRTASLYSSRQNSAIGTPIRTHSRSADEKSASVLISAVSGKGHTPSFINDADPEKTPFVPYVDDRMAFASLYVDQKEDDDDMHMPAWDDDAKFRPSWADRFSRQNIVNTLGMIFLLIGLLCIFVILPVVSFTGTNLIPYTYETPLDQMPGYVGETPAWAHVNDKVYPLLQNIRRGLIDPDTPQSARTRKSTDGTDLVLVFSDEFNRENRTFYPGDDPYWFAPDFWYGATQDLEWYDPDAANTGGGTLRLQLDKFPNHGLDYRSAMLNSWNQLCFKGGAFEVSMSLPGPAGKHAYWPGVWTIGNLGRPGYLATTDGLWPYTYDSCDVGITPNQSSPDGISNLPGQRLASCTCPGEDHPTPGRGRGAPEIDIAEVSADWGGLNLGVATQSYQVAPFDVWYYPNYDFMENQNYSISQVNTWVGGPYQQAVSTTSMLNNDWYDGKEFQKYAFEYKPGSDEDAFIAWFIGDQEMMKFDARAIGPNGNIGQRLISEEPMSMVLNLGFSHNWVDIDWAVLKFPTVMQIDYVRWYQPAGSWMVTCDPPGYETTEYIKNHPEPYNNVNLTHWSDAGYSWPKNSFMHGCSK